MLKISESTTFKKSAISAVIILAVYTLHYLFYGMCWLIIIFVDLFAFVFFSIVFFNSIVFWLRNLKKFDQPYVPFLINALVIILIICLPSFNRNKSYPRGSFNLKTYQKDCSCKLYIERYTVFGSGAWGADMDSLYLTDSTNFRKYLGTYDEEAESITTKCIGNSIVVEKTTNTSSIPEWNWPGVIERNIYDVKQLTNSHIFD